MHVLVICGVVLLVVGSLALILASRPQLRVEAHVLLFRMGLVRTLPPAAVSSCIANLKQLDGATQQWALENNLAATNTYALTDPTLLAWLKGSVLPTCPRHGRYSPGTNLMDAPRCSHPGHTL